MQKTENPLIFIVEDSLVYKDLLVAYLESKGYNNLKVFDSPNECSKYLNLQPDVIVLDYVGDYSRSGLEFMIQVKNEHPHVDFIFLSAQNDLEVAVRIMKVGAADYIVKDDQAPHKLVKSIESLIAVARRQKKIKGFKIGVMGFFILLFLVIMVIIFLSIYLEWTGF